MPRPHYPTTGGPHLPSWNTGEARKRHRAQTVASSAGTDAKTEPGQSSAIRRPGSAGHASYSATPANRAGVSNSKFTPAPPNTPACLPPQNRSGASAVMLWAAVSLSVAALLFTILAILHHG